MAARACCACACPARRPRWPARGSRSAATRWNRTAQAWWRSLREQTHTFFEPGKPLWRLALLPTAAALDLGPTLLEWGGGQRWLCGNYEAAALRERASLGGHATLFRPAGMSVPEDGVFHPLAPALALITRRLKQELDPAGLFNPGRLILEL